jgi:hypothetical protein
MWGDTGRYMLVPVKSTTCKHTHTHTSVLASGLGYHWRVASSNRQLTPATRVV